MREGKIQRDLEDIHELSCLINKPTRMTDTSRTLIDVILTNLTNKPEIFKESDVYDPGLSDHRMAYAVTRENAIHYPSKVISFRSVKNEEELLKDFSVAPRHVGNIFDSVDDRYFYWSKLVNDVLDNHALQKKLRVWSRDVEYMTPEWKTAIRMKRKYTKKFAKDPSQENLINKNKWRNTATKLRRRAIKGYWKTKTDSSGSNPKDFFKVFKPFLDSKARGNDNNVINTDFNDSIIQYQTKAANCLVDCFTTVANDIGDPHMLSLTEEELKDHKSIQNIRKVATTNGVQFKFRNFNVKEVTRALETLNPNKSIGHDKIPPRVLKLACNVLAPSLTNIFNVCIQTSNWPEQWKRGIWVPLHKKDNHSDIKNYRSITILAAVDKVFEQLLSNQVTQFMEPYLSNCLTAYRKQNSWRDDFDQAYGGLERSIG